MTDPISNQMSRLTNTAGQARLADKTDNKAAVTPLTAEAHGTERKTVASDSLELSGVSQRLNSQPEFDRSKVDAIKESIKNGTYPLNSRRIAESFVALEQMISG